MNYNVNIETIANGFVVTTSKYDPSLTYMPFDDDEAPPPTKTYVANRDSLADIIASLLS